MKTVEPGGRGLGIHRQDDLKGTKYITGYRGLADFAGREAMVAGFGEQLVGFKEAEILTLFSYFINPDRVRTDLSSGAWSATISDSRLKVTAGTGSLVGDAIVQSLQVIGYRPGFDSYLYCTTAFEPFAVGTTQEFGPFDGTNGYSISLLSNGEIAINHYSNTVLVSTTPQSEFILDHLDGKSAGGFILNPQAMNIYRFNYGYLGTMPPSFEIWAGVELGWIPFHYIDLTGVDNSLIIRDPYLPVRFRVTSDGTNEVSMYSGSWDGGIIGSPRPRFLNDQYTVDVEKLGVASAGINKPLISIRNNTTFKTKTNKITVDIDTLTAAVDGNKTHRVRLIKNPTTLTGAVFNSVNASSVMSYDTAATAMTGGEIKRSWPLGKIDSLGGGAIFETGELRMFPGDIYVLALISTSVATDFVGALHWDELK